MEDFLVKALTALGGFLVAVVPMVILYRKSRADAVKQAMETEAEKQRLANKLEAEKQRAADELEAEKQRAADELAAERRKASISEQEASRKLREADAQFQSESWRQIVKDIQANYNKMLGEVGRLRESHQADKERSELQHKEDIARSQEAERRCQDSLRAKVQELELLRSGAS